MNTDPPRGGIQPGHPLAKHQARRHRPAGLHRRETIHNGGNDPVWTIRRPPALWESPCRSHRNRHSPSKISAWEFHEPRSSGQSSRAACALLSGKFNRASGNWAAAQRSGRLGWREAKE